MLQLGAVVSGTNLFTSGITKEATALTITSFAYFEPILNERINNPQAITRVTSSVFVWLSFGTPEGIRTPDPLVRSQILYPAELLAHICSFKHLYIISPYHKFVNTFFKSHIQLSMWIDYISENSIPKFEQAENESLKFPSKLNFAATHLSFKIIRIISL